MLTLYNQGGMGRNYSRVTIVPLVQALEINLFGANVVLEATSVERLRDELTAWLSTQPPVEPDVVGSIV